VQSIVTGRVDILGPVEQPGETPKISTEEMNNLLDAYLEK